MLPGVFSWGEEVASSLGTCVHGLTLVACAARCALQAQSP